MADNYAKLLGKTSWKRLGGKGKPWQMWCITTPRTSPNERSAARSSGERIITVRSRGGTEVASTLYSLIEQRAWTAAEHHGKHETD